MLHTARTSMESIGCAELRCDRIYGGCKDSVFGMKNGDSAFLGRITGGDALAIVNADVSGKLNSYNYVYPEFCVREIELLNMFGVSGNQADVPGT